MKIVLAGYGSRGDVEPCAVVGRELLRRGHDVSIAVPPNIFGLVQSAGLTAASYGPDSQQQLNTAAANLIAGLGLLVLAQQRFLTRISRRIYVGDVITGCIERALRRIQPAHGVQQRCIQAAHNDYIWHDQVWCFNLGPEASLNWPCSEPKSEDIRATERLECSSRAA